MDELEHVIEESGLDGFMLDPLFGTADIVDFAELVMPELRRRGGVPETHEGETLRSRLSCTGASRPRSRPSAAHERTPCRPSSSATEQ